MQKSNYYTITALALVVAHITGTNSATVLEDKWLCFEYYVCVYYVVFCQHFVSLLNVAVQMWLWNSWKHLMHSLTWTQQHLLLKFLILAVTVLAQIAASVVRFVCYWLFMLILGMVNL